MKLARRMILITLATMLLTLIFASAATNVIVTQYEVDKKDIRNGDSFTLDISFKQVGGTALGNNLTLINTSSENFAMADGNRAVKITNPAVLFSAKLDLEYIGEGNAFAFSIIDDATGETVASDTIVISQITKDDDSSSPQPPTDTAKFEPQFEIVNQPFAGEFVTTKKYSLIVKLKNNTSVFAKDVTATIEKSEAALPFDMSASTLTASQSQVAYKKEADFIFNFTLDPTALSKRYAMNLKLTFKNSHGDSFSQLIPIVLNVNNTNSLPLIDVIDTAVEGGSLDGVAKNVTLTLANGGTLAAKDVQISLAGFTADGLSLQSDIATKQIGEIGAGQRIDVAYMIKAMPQTEGIKTLTATIKYRDPSGEAHEKTTEIFIDSGFNGLAKSLAVKFDKAQYYMSSGQTINVGLTVKNRSQQDIENLQLDVNADGLQMMSTYIKLIDKLKAGETQSFTFAVAAGEGIAKNTYPIKAELKAANKEAPAAATAISGITVEEKTATEVGKPKVIIDSYDYGGDFIMAGEVFPLTINLKNTSTTMGIKNVKASYLSDDNVFIPVDSSNSVFIEKIGSGEVVTKTVMVKTKNDAAPKTYVLDFTIAYEDEKGNAYDAKDNPYEEKERISINLKQKNRLEVPEINLPPMVMVGEPVNLDVNFFNMGKSTMYNLLVSTEGDFETREATNYVGTFEPGKSEYYTATIIATQPGEAKGKIIFSFEDSNGEAETIEKELTLNVVEGGMSGGEDGFPDDFKPGDGDIPDDMMPPQEGAGFNGIAKIIAIGIAIIVAIIVIIVLIKRRNKKRKAALLEIEDETD